MQQNKMIVFVDMDGTIANIDERVKLSIKMKTATDKFMNWDVFLSAQNMQLLDKPQMDVINTVRALASAGHTIHVVSARNERHREVTSNQLLSWGVSHESLTLRKDDDFRPDNLFKEEVLNTFQVAGITPDLVIDDRQQVVDMWRSKGIPCFQVRQWEESN